MAAKIKGKRYPDLRHKFIRALIAYERWQRSKHYLKSSAEWTSKAIVSLELSEKPVKSVKQAAQLEGIGGELGRKLKEIHTSSKYSQDPPPGGMFVSSSGPLLVALLNAKEQMIMESDSETERVFVPAERIHELAQPLCEEVFAALPPSGEHSESGFCPAWWRMRILETRGYVKKRSLHKKPVYELLPMGQEIAYRLRASSSLQAAHQAGHPQKGGTLPNTDVQEEVALYTNDDGTDGLILLVDTQEWGGDRAGLGQLVGLLNHGGLRYRTRKLPLGDYVWFQRTHGREIPLPLIVERKRADDLAHSIRDGRYNRQKEKMVEWKNSLGDLSEEAGLLYLVEGDPADYVVQCVDGCGGVGRCGNPTLQHVQVENAGVQVKFSEHLHFVQAEFQKMVSVVNQDAIGDLSSNSDFSLLQTENIENTVDILASMTAELRQRVLQGEFNAILREVNGVPLPGGKAKPPNMAKQRKNCNIDRPGGNKDTGKSNSNVRSRVIKKTANNLNGATPGVNQETVKSRKRTQKPSKSRQGPQVDMNDKGGYETVLIEGSSVAEDFDPMLSEAIKESLLSKAIEESRLTNAVRKFGQVDGVHSTMQTKQQMEKGRCKSPPDEHVHTVGNKHGENEEYIPARKRQKTAPSNTKQNSRRDEMAIPSKHAFSPPGSSCRVVETQKADMLVSSHHYTITAPNADTSPKRNFSFLSLKSTFSACPQYVKGDKPNEQVTGNKFLLLPSINNSTDSVWLSRENGNGTKFKHKSASTATKNPNWAIGSSFVDSDNSLPDLFDDEPADESLPDLSASSALNYPNLLSSSPGKGINVGHTLPNASIIDDTATIEKLKTSFSSGEEVNEEEVAMVMAILPNVPRATVIRKLIECYHNVEHAVGELLDQDG